MNDEQAWRKGEAPSSWRTIQGNKSGITRERERRQIDATITSWKEMGSEGPSSKKNSPGGPEPAK